jgi:hypothetical protein
MNPLVYSEPSALHAQAIASRSYAGWFINNAPGDINNSSARQVFIPYKFDSLNPAASLLEPSAANPCASDTLNSAQRMACAAIASRYYIARSEVNLPAFAEFTADARTQTVSHPEQATRFPYLLGVANPISAACDANDLGNLRGLSQEGANRWARGHQCSYPAAPTLPGNQAGSFWSVRWDRVEQILVHYYTGIHVRDANGTRLTPDNRWNPLSINWNTPGNRPPITYRGSSYPVAIQVQNTSVADWTINGQSWALSYRWAKAGMELDSTNRAWITGRVNKGNPPYLFTLNIDDIPNWGVGAYTLKFDMILRTYGRDYWFSRYYGWPTYDVTICVGGPCRVFIPVVLKNS